MGHHYVGIPTSHVSVFKLGRVLALFPQLSLLANSTAIICYKREGGREGGGGEGRERGREGERGRVEGEGEGRRGRGRGRGRICYCRLTYVYRQVNWNLLNGNIKQFVEMYCKEPTNSLNYSP